MPNFVVLGLTVLELQFDGLTSIYTWMPKLRATTKFTLFGAIKNDEISFEYEQTSKPLPAVSHQATFFLACRKFAKNKMKIADANVYSLLKKKLLKSL